MTVPLMKIYQKYLSGNTSGKGRLKLEFPYKLKKIFFLARKIPVIIPLFFFNNLPINRKSTQKHLGLLLDEKLSFSEHINEKPQKVKSINLLRKLNLTLPRSSLLIKDKSEKLYQEIGFESLIKDRPWMRKHCYLYKIISSKRPSYLYNMLPPLQRPLKVSYSHCCVEEKSLKTLFYHIRYISNILGYMNGTNQIQNLGELICTQVLKKY